MRIIWQTLRRITNEILGVKGSFLLSVLIKKVFLKFKICSEEMGKFDWMDMLVI